jgi:histidinol-phosphate aminotransferase
MSLIRSNVLRMEPYSPGKPISEVRRELGLDRIIKLASNENPFGPSPKAVAAVQEAAKTMHLYPDADAFDLKKAIADRYGIPAGQVLLGNGSDELIHMLGMLYLGSPEDEVVVGDPSFVRYDAAAFLAPSKLIKVPLDSDYRHDLPAMARAATNNAKLLFIANPNNPTGTIVRQAELISFLKDLPENVTTILDEAYFEFAQADPGYPDSVDLIRDGYRVIGLRTFSKTFGLAGIRLG